jgi:hypothetical protein
MRVNRFFKLLAALTLLSPWTMLPAHSVDYNCTSFSIPNWDHPDWSISNSKDLRIVFTWRVNDPQQCVAGLEKVTGLKNFFVKYSSPTQNFDTTWNFERSGDVAVVTATFEVPIQWLQAWDNTGEKYSTGMQQNFPDIQNTLMGLNDQAGKHLGDVHGEISKATLWGIWFSKNQGLDTSQCDYPLGSTNYTPPNIPLNPDFEVKILEYGYNPKIQISVNSTKNCIFLLHSGPLKATSDNLSLGAKYLSEAPFWNHASQVFFSSILGSQNQIIQIGIGGFARNCNCNPSGGANIPFAELQTEPNLVSHTDFLSQVSEEIRVTSSLDLNGVPQNAAEVGIYVGYYYWYNSAPTSGSGRWMINWTSPSTFTATYQNGFYSSPIRVMQYQSHYISIPLKDLLLSPEVKAAADKAAADKAAADKAAADKAAADKAAADKAAADAKTKSASSTKSTITCVKGKLVKKIPAYTFSCPKGYKVQK